MMLGLSLVLCAAATATGTPDQQAARFVVHEFERVGRANPQPDAALNKAAQTLAQQALETSAADAAELTNLTLALSVAGGWDATPRALVLRGTPLDEPLNSLLQRTDFSEEASSHYGVGWASAKDTGALVVLLSQRRAELQPFPRVIAKKGLTAPLCATLDPRYLSAEVYVTRPKGDVDRLPLTRKGDQLCTPIAFAVDGRHTIEILARGDKGPEVVALFFVRVGAAAINEKTAREVEPTSLPDARAKLLARINGLRAGYALAPLAADAALDAIAQAYAQRMANEGFFAHVAPDGSDVRARLKAAAYPYRAAGENLGQASGPLAAHFGLEHSPGHRKNLLDPGYTVAGIGVVKNPQGQTVLVEVMATPIETEGDPFDLAYGALEKARKAKGLPALSRIGALEQLATQHARAALEADIPKAELNGNKLHDRLFAARDDLASAAVDVYVTESPTMITESRNLEDPHATLVGIGIAHGDSPTYGKSKYWVVVVYGRQR